MTIPYYSIVIVSIGYAKISTVKIPVFQKLMLKLVHANKRLKVIIFKKGRETSNNKNL